VTFWFFALKSSNLFREEAMKTHKQGEMVVHFLVSSESLLLFQFLLENLSLSQVDFPVRIELEDGSRALFLPPNIRRRSSRSFELS